MNTKINADNSGPGMVNGSTPANQQGTATMDRILELMEVIFFIFNFIA